ncbi:MAG: sulfatase-like hydrolase/transferase [Deltaproteobacteria bacterium]|nr:sulfatase-like hydrolase/transferase [Deltaproteobacteria bacterium]
MRVHARRTGEGLGVSVAALLPLLAVLLLQWGCRDGGVAPPPPRPPNIVLYIVDTLRSDGLASYGNPSASTPHFDRLAAEGVVFENAYANASWTRASIATIVTGLYPSRHLAERRADSLPDEVETLSEVLLRNGYTTGLITTNPNAGRHFGFDVGFDSMIELYRRNKPGRVHSFELITASDRVTDRAMEWIGAVPEPFFLTIVSVDPHAPYRPPERFDRAAGAYTGSADGSFEHIDRPDLDATDRRRIRALYDAEVSFNDDSFGALLAHLDELGIRDDTIVALTSDHGEEFWEIKGRRGHGRSLSEAVTRVPLVVRYPRGGRVPAGKRVAAPVELADVVPTILDLAALPVPAGLDGRALFSGEPDPARAVYASLDLDGYRIRSLRKGPWKLLWYEPMNRFELFRLDEPGGEERPIPQNAGPQARRARSELKRELAAIVARDAARVEAPEGQPEAVPADVEDAMRALGYIE